MGTVKAVAWACFLVGILGFGLLAVLIGPPWIAVTVVWLGFWAIVGLLSELDQPSFYN